MKTRNIIITDNSKVVMGIDPKVTGTGVAVIKDGSLIFNQTITSKKEGLFRALDIEEKILQLYKRFNCDIVVIEGYGFASKKIVTTAELVGILKRAFLKEVDPVPQIVIVAPTQLKQFATGKGNAKKEFIMLEIFKRWGVEFETDDEADAFVLAKIGHILLNGNNDEGLTKIQKKVIKKIKAGNRNEGRIEE
jgi:crossover junction endodeoxyribonuclease RuvC